MKKLLLILVLAIITPQIAFAAWWNPFSWYIFSGSSAPNTSQNQELDYISETSQEDVDMGNVHTYYLRVDSNVRACPSLSCEIMKTELKNSTISFSKSSGYLSVSDLPDWVRFSWTESGKQKFGYISKRLLASKPVLDNQNNIVQENNKSDKILEQQNNEALNNLNKTLEEMKIQLQENSKLPQCGGKAWKECQDGYTFYCSDDGIAHCVLPKKTISSSSIQDNSIYQKKVVTDDATTTKNNLIDYFIQNKLLVDDWQNNQTCQLAYKTKETNIDKSLKILIQYCVNRGGYYPVSSSQPSREVCLGSKYDPYTSTLLLQACKSW